jgi:hypothetical protein
LPKTGIVLPARTQGRQLRQHLQSSFSTETSVRRSSSRTAAARLGIKKLKPHDRSAIELIV